MGSSEKKRAINVASCMMSRKVRLEPRCALRRFHLRTFPRERVHGSKGTVPQGTSRERMMLGVPSLELVPFCCAKRKRPQKNPSDEQPRMERGHASPRVTIPDSSTAAGRQRDRVQGPFGAGEKKPGGRFRGRLGWAKSAPREPCPRSVDL